MIKNGGASFVTLDTGLQLYAFSLFRLELKPRRRDSAEEAHCSADSHGNAERSVGGYQGQAACTLLEYSRFSPTSNSVLSDVTPAIDAK